MEIEGSGRAFCHGGGNRDLNRNRREQLGAQDVESFESERVAAETGGI